MNRRVLVFLSLVMLVALAAATVPAQTPANPNHAAIEKQIAATERAINDAFAKGDVKAFHANIAPDALSIDPTGVIKVNSDYDKMMASVKIQTWNIDSSQFYWVGDTTVVHMYRGPVRERSPDNQSTVPHGHRPSGQTRVESGWPSSIKKRQPSPQQHLQPVENKLQVSPSPPGRGWHEAPGEGRKALSNPETLTLPSLKGEGGFSFENPLPTALPPVTAETVDAFQVFHRLIYGRGCNIEAAFLADQTFRPVTAGGY